MADGDITPYLVEVAQRFCLPVSLVTRAYTLFEHYRKEDVRGEEEEVRGVPVVSAPSTEHASAPLPAPSQGQEIVEESTAVFTSHADAHELDQPVDISVEPTAIPPAVAPVAAAAVTEVIGVAGLQSLFKDLGQPKSASELAELVQQQVAVARPTMEGDPANHSEAADATPEASPARDGTAREAMGSVAKSTHELGEGKKSRKSKLGDSAGANRTTATAGEEKKQQKKKKGDAVATTASTGVAAGGASVTGAASGVEGSGVAAGPPRGLSFPQFVFLLLQRLSPEEEESAAKDEEAGALFDRLDVDKDTLLSETDLRQFIASIFEFDAVLSQDPGIVRLVTMHPLEIRTALAECDVDGDGAVSKADLIALLRS